MVSLVNAMLRYRPPPPVWAGAGVYGVRPRGPTASKALGRQTGRGEIEHMLDSFWEVRSLSPDRALRLRTYGNPYPSLLPGTHTGERCF